MIKTIMTKVVEFALDKGILEHDFKVDKTIKDIKKDFKFYKIECHNPISFLGDIYLCATVYYDENSYKDILEGKK